MSPLHRPRTDDDTDRPPTTRGPWPGNGSDGLPGMAGVTGMTGVTGRAAGGELIELDEVDSDDDYDYDDDDDDDDGYGYPDDGYDDDGYGSDEGNEKSGPADGPAGGDHPEPRRSSGGGAGVTDRTRDHHLATPREVIARMLVIAAVASLLGSQHLLNVAERMPFGRNRSITVAAATALDEAAGVALLDEPDRWLRIATGRPLPDSSGGGDGDPNLLASLPVEPTVPGGPSGTRQPSTVTTAGPPRAEHTVPAPAETTTTVPVPALRAVDPADKLRIWAGGDSLGEYIGNNLFHPLADRNLTEVQLDYHISTGLARPDYYDWQQRMWDLMHQERPPEVLVFMVGGNDNQNMQIDGAVLQLGTPEWNAEYARRAAFVMDVASVANAQLYWIGLPPMREADVHQVAMTLNELVRQQAEARPWVTYVDLVPSFVGPDGNFSTNLADPATGEQKVARADDGIHITLTGSTWVAQDLWEDIAERWSLLAPPPPPETTTTTAPVTTDTSAVAAVPPTGATPIGPPLPDPHATIDTTPIGPPLPDPHATIGATPIGPPLPDPHATIGATPIGLPPPVAARVPDGGGSSGSRPPRPSPGRYR